MGRDGAVGLLVGVGHVAWFVLIVNVVHALGLSERRMNAVKVILLAVMGLLTASLAVATVQGGWDEWPWAIRAYALLCLGMAAVGLPATTVMRMFRAPPAGVTECSSHIDFEAVHETDALVGHGRHAWQLRLPGNESLQFRRRDWDLALPNLPPAWDGLTIVQLSDLHFAPCYQRRYFELVAAQASEREADVVVFTGDLVDHDEALDWIVPILSTIRGRLGNFAILGNHDENHHPETIGRLLEEAGFTFLNGDWTELAIEGRTLAIGGTCVPWGPPLDLGARRDADFRLLLSHSPDLFYRAAAAGIDLMLSGHNHGGQVRFPVIGPVFMPSLYSRRFDRGFFRSGPTLMHVSQGVGGKHPVRYGCVPEIGRFSLRPARDAADRTPASRSTKQRSGAF